MQFNVVSRETLLDAQKHPENLRRLSFVLQATARCSPLFQKSLQDDIINRTEQQRILRKTEAKYE